MSDQAPVLPIGWVSVPLAEIAEVRLGRQRSPDRAQGEYMRPYMRAANVTWDGISLEDVKEMDFTPQEFKVYALRAGDILLGEASGSAGEVGKPAIWNEEITGACFQNTLIRVRSAPQLVPHLYWHFRHDALTGAFAGASQGIGIHHLGRDKLAKWPVKLPPLAEQQRIVSRLRDIQTRILKVRNLLAGVTGATVSSVENDLDLLERSVLTQAFCGDLVEQDPADEPASVLLERIRAERNGTGRPATEQSPPPTKLVVSRYIVMLLRTWEMPAARETLETCLVLMMNDDARRAILGKKPVARAKSKKTVNGRTHMPGLDHLLGELVTGRILTPPEAVKGKQVFGIGPKAPTAADIKVVVSGEDEQRLKETLQALEALGEERARLELDAVPHANYEFVS